MQKKIIYVFGSLLLDFDSLPLMLIKDLQAVFPQIDFQIIDPNENLKPIDKKMVIIDTVEGIDKVTIITDIDQLVLTQLYSPHDFDLGFNLQLLKKLGLLDEILIFGVPMEIKKQTAFEQLVLVMRQYYL